MVSSLFETGFGLAAAIAWPRRCPTSPGGPRRVDHGLATAGLLEHDLLAGPLVVEDGRMWLPLRRGAGGLGIEVDEAALERFAADAA